MSVMTNERAVVTVTHGGLRDETHVRLVSSIIAFTINLCEPFEAYNDPEFDSAVSNFRLYQNNDYTSIVTYGPESSRYVAEIAAKAIEINPGWWCVTFTDGPRQLSWVKRQQKEIINGTE